jgi:hypothetical protein
VIDGTAFAPVPGFTTVYVYANRTVGADGYAEGEEFVGSVKVVFYESPFSLTVPRDLRGLYLDAYSVVRTDYGDAAWDTMSEFCKPMRAE